MMSKTNGMWGTKKYRAFRMCLNLSDYQLKTNNSPYRLTCMNLKNQKSVSCTRNKEKGIQA